MNRIVNDLKTFAKEYKNCDKIEQLIRYKHSTLTGIEPPIILTIASGFLYNIPQDKTFAVIEFISEQPHLVPFKESIMYIIDGVKTNNPLIEVSRSIVYSI